MRNLNASLRATKAAKQGTEGYIQDAIKFSVNFPPDCFVELARDTEQCLDTGKRFGVLLIPLFDYVKASSKAYSRFGIFSGDFHSLFRRFEMRDNRDFSRMLAKRSSEKKHSFLRVLG